MRTKAGSLLVTAAATIIVLTGCANFPGPGSSAPEPGATTVTPTATATATPTAGPTATSAAPATTGTATPPPSTSQPAATPSQAQPGAPKPTPGVPTTGLPGAGNPQGTAAVPAEAGAVDVSDPTQVIGSGTPGSCTSDAVVAAVAAGGIITFDCGPDPVTITMTSTAKIVNANGPQVVLDGGGKVTLSGGGQHRILYMNTCDQAQGWTTSHCDNQDHPQLTVQNLTFADGNSTGDEPDGGGAIFVRGGQFKIVNSVFAANRCDPTGPDLGGAAVRVFDQYQDRPVYVVNSTFQGGSCSNGGALSSIGVSWTILNSVFRDNEAVGDGANPAQAGTPGGGSGGAIYCDGNLFHLRIAGSIIEDNSANEGGGAIFFVSNDRTGTLAIEGSTLRANPSAGFETTGYPGIFFLGAGSPSITASTLS